MSTQSNIYILEKTYNDEPTLWRRALLEKLAVAQVLNR
jgi:hypothetical protein